MASFTPVYDQPVTLAALNQLEPEILTQEVTRLQNSIYHLERSQTELQVFLDESRAEAATAAAEAREADIDEDDLSEIVKSMDENKVTIASQRERLQMIRIALQNQLGVDSANAHYTLAQDGPTTAAAPTPSNGAASDAPAAATTVNGTTAEEDGDGVYL